MKFSAKQLEQRLKAALGGEAVKANEDSLANHLIDAEKPSLLCLPGHVDEVAATLRICYEADASVVVWGGGTAMAIGNLPRQADVVVGLSRLNALMEHDHANLTVTAQSGMTSGEMQRMLARHNQFLPFDPPHPASSTIGGVVAASLNGPRRASYGSVRDLVIGMKVLLATGEQIKAGGKVVKNVAGYDMCKLFVGSLGSLGIIMEVTLRVAPIPESAATVIVSGTCTEVFNFIEEHSRSSLLPAAVMILNNYADPRSRLAQDDWMTAVWCEGFEETVARQVNDECEMAKRMRLSVNSLRDQTHSQFWEQIQNFPLQDDRCAYRVTVPRASLAEVINSIRSWESADCHPAIVSDAAIGTVWISLPAGGGDPKWFKKLIALGQEHSGHAMLYAAPPNLKIGLDVWGPPPMTLRLMREIKHQFDPKGLLNPGRFIGGI
jgi:glycolate dehydrogenase FAD-binding subunit